MVQGQCHADFPAMRVDGEVRVASEALAQGVVDDGVYTAVRIRGRDLEQGVDTENRFKSRYIQGQTYLYFKWIVIMV